MKNEIIVFLILTGLLILISTLGGSIRYVENFYLDPSEAMHLSGSSYPGGPVETEAEAEVAGEEVDYAPNMMSGPPNMMSGSPPNMMSGSPPNMMSGSPPNMMSGSPPNMMSGPPNMMTGPPVTMTSVQPTSLNAPMGSIYQQEPLVEPFDGDLYAPAP